MNWINKFHLGHASDLLSQMPSESVNCVVTSPPYWGLRDYGIEPVIWDGVEGCEHKWVANIKKPIGGKGSKCANVGANKNDFANIRDHNIESNFCQLCGAWKGSLGLEPSFDLYIKHLCDIFDEVKRVLRKDGTCWVNLGDSYGGSGNASGHTENTKNLGRGTLGAGATQGNQKTTRQHAKSLCLIPQRFAIEMVNPNWVLREDLTEEEKKYVLTELINRSIVNSI